MFISLGANRQLKKKLSMAPFNTVMDLNEDVLHTLTFAPHHICTLGGDDAIQAPEINDCEGKIFHC
jgi:hypothetical protein